jgi:YidC/Oxa1 family membrane protein insertase
MGQQFVVIRNMPTPGSPAYAEWEKRQTARNIRKGIVAPTPDEVDETPKAPQREQPRGKNRSKRGKGKK